MTQLTTAGCAGITFAVDEVTPANEPLKLWRAHDAVRRMVGSDIESCSDFHGEVVVDVWYQPLLAAVYLAYNQHRPLVLTPDAVWITIAQGVAHHMAVHGERLRSRFVAHQGKLDLVFECDWPQGSPENPWTEAFASWSGQIRDHVGPAVHDALACDFSTSGPVERAVGDVVMMDIFQRYFNYEMVGICGIPTVTLHGTPDDWRRLRDKAAALSIFDLDWWVAHLLPICDEFIQASRGNVNLTHWQDICKLARDYGGDRINGWVGKLFPYLRECYRGPCTFRNPILETGEGFTTLLAPPGLSRVPFTWKDARSGRRRPMEAIGGYLGVSQDPHTLALAPKIGWAVRDAETMDALLERVEAEHGTAPGFVNPAAQPWREYFAPDLGTFYHRSNGAELFGRGAAAAYRIVPRAQMEPLEWGEPRQEVQLRGPGGRSWRRLAFCADGSWLAINLDQNRPDPRPDGPGRGRDITFHAICHCSAASIGREGMNPVVALSFTELLERLLASGGKPFWEDPSFNEYGDAHKYTNWR